MFEEQWISDTIHTLRLYYTPIIVTLGTIGNCLTICVFLSNKLNNTSTSFYLAALAICDTGYLIYAFVNWVELTGYKQFDQEICKFTLYLSQLCRFTSVWFVVAFTVERFVAVCYPLRQKSICTVFR